MLIDLTISRWNFRWIHVKKTRWLKKILRKNLSWTSRELWKNRQYCFSGLKLRKIHFLNWISIEWTNWCENQEVNFWFYKLGHCCCIWSQSCFAMTHFDFSNWNFQFEICLCKSFADRWIWLIFNVNRLIFLMSSSIKDILIKISTKTRVKATLCGDHV